MSTEANKAPTVSAARPSAQSPTVAPPRKSSSGVLLAITLLAALGGGGFTWFAIERGCTAEAAHAVDASSAPKYLAHLEGFTVNLADPEETHFLRVTMDLGLDRLPDGSDRVKSTTLLPVARIRDSILSVLTVCKADALLSPGGKAQLKKDLVAALNHNVPQLGVRDVYFTEFLVQR
jgi:flagellar FliL protein